jgi:hypothetical protein
MTKANPVGLSSLTKAVFNEIGRLQNAQDNLLAHITESLETISEDSSQTETLMDSIAAAGEIYAGTVIALKSRLGDGAPCHLVDIAKWRLYRDAYLARHGKMPETPVSTTSATEFLAEANKKSA